MSSHPARRLLLLSNSTLHPTGYLEYAQSHISDFFAGAGVKRILFVPYALNDHDDYTATASEKLGKWGFEASSNIQNSVNLNNQNSQKSGPRLREFRSLTSPWP